MAVLFRVGQHERVSCTFSEIAISLKKYPIRCSRKIIQETALSSFVIKGAFKFNTLPECVRNSSQLYAKAAIKTDHLKIQCDVMKAYS
jgi:hypothetical protein